MNDTQVAEAVAKTMWHDDQCSQSLGMTLLSVKPGAAEMRMIVRGDMINGHGTCHGGIIFTFADSCFAFACNSYNQRAVAMNCTIDFIAPARLGDTLIASTREVSRAGRNGIYDIRVCLDSGAVVAEFRGKSRLISGVITELPA
ncbi:MAG: phenylacetic acid degradation protein PaaD [marine bacterium B5-7]|nr:MAG: phenylacetic acid degradation protein PaaD [marine bacterium B5-7]